MGEKPPSVAEVETALGAIADDPNANGTLKALAGSLPAPQGWRRTDTIAFNSARKWSAASFDGRGSYVLGAPDVLLRKDDSLRDKVLTMASTGQRGVLLMHTDTALAGQELPTGVRPLALVALTEQIRPDAKDTLDFFASQGVEVKIISGDNPDTVSAIARRVGLDLSPDQVVDARTIGTDVEALREVARRTTVFGRVNPDQKRALVQALQRDGHVVAMTGDRVNDALAIKDADIGVAMNNGAQPLSGRPARAARRQVLPSAVGARRGPTGHQQRRARREPLRRQERHESHCDRHRRGRLSAVPVPARHLTLVSAVTIGIPAFFLALGPNKRRYTPGFLRRVLRFAVPAGAVCGLVVIASYLLAHVVFDTLSAGQCAGASQGTVPQAAAEACWQPSTAASVSLLVAAFWILIVLARPFAAWKYALVGGCIAIAVGAFAIPIAQNFFQYSAPAAMVWQSLAVGAVGAPWPSRSSTAPSRVTATNRRRSKVERQPRMELEAQGPFEEIAALLHGRPCERAEGHVRRHVNRIGSPRARTPSTSA